MGKPNILVVEDERIVARDIEISLKNLGFEVCGSVASGEEAVARAEELRPDLILMDIFLKGEMNGVEAAAQIRQRFDVPVVYLTAHTDENTLRRAKVTEPYGYILKPFEEKEIRIGIEMALNKHGLEKRTRENQGWLSAALRGVADGVIAADREGVVIFLNPAAEHLTGWGQKDACGRALGEVLRTAEEEGHPARESAAEGLRQGRFASSEIPRTLISRDGTRRPVGLLGGPVVDDEGNPMAAVVIMRDEAERRRLEEKLARQAAELARARTDLEEFTDLAGHGLQEPLRGIIAFVKLLARRYRGQLGPEADEFLESALAEAQYLENLIDGLIAYSCVGRGGAFEPVDGQSLLEKALAGLKEMVEAAGAQVTHDPLPLLRGDGPQLVQVVQHLIENAVKFRREEPPRIHLSAKLRNGEWILTVRDNGLGIPREYFPRLFGVFQPLHRREQYPGTGVGLALCRKIVERHGGRIWLESEPGKGSIFYVALPQEHREDGEGAGKTVRPIEVLLVEDNPHEVRLTRIAWQESKMANPLFVVGDGAEALAFLRREGDFFRAPRPDLILLDLSLPGRDGREILAEIKADPCLLNIPVMVLTASRGEEDLLKSSRLPADGYLTKPVDPQQILKVVEAIGPFRLIIAQNDSPGP